MVSHKKYNLNAIEGFVVFDIYYNTKSLIEVLRSCGDPCSEWIL